MPSDNHMGEAVQDLNLNDQEQNLYAMHVKNLYGSGGVDHEDGSRSTLYQSVQQHDGKFYNVPTVWNGQIETEPYTRDDGKTFDVPNKTALDNVSKIGWDHFPSYATAAEADSRYDAMHNYMEQDTQAFLSQRAGDNYRDTMMTEPEVKVKPQLQGTALSDSVIKTFQAYRKLGEPIRAARDGNAVPGTPAIRESSLTDWLGLTSPDKSAPEAHTPENQQWPTQDDALNAIKYNFGYGSGNETFINSKTARIFTDDFGRPSAPLGLDTAETVAAARQGSSFDLTKFKNLDVKAKLGTMYAQGALAVNRSPVAALGFDPSNATIDIKTKELEDKKLIQARVAGLTDEKDRSQYVNTMVEGVLAHESTHAGLMYLEKQEPERYRELFNQLPSYKYKDSQGNPREVDRDELLVRYLMYKYTGDPEYTGDKYPHNDMMRQKARDIYEANPKFQTIADQIQEMAIKAIKDKRPRGPA